MISTPPPPPPPPGATTDNRSITIQGRIGIQALKKYKALPGGGMAFRKQFYKGGFENRMTRQEAILILQLRYASFFLFFLLGCSSRRRRRLMDGDLLASVI